jgi:MFS transporter, DHA2 family, multidrug resistance protein
MPEAPTLAPNAELPDGLQPPQRNWAMLAIMTGILLSSLDASIVNIALPTISREMAVTPASTIWMVNSYQLAMAVSILPLSAVGERIGYRRLYCSGLAAFTLFSLMAALSPNFTVLIVARVLQGVSAAAVNSVSQALVRCIYPRRILGSGMSWYTLMVGISYGLGPVLGSAILSVASWPWMFAINVPVGSAALAIGLRTLPESPRHIRGFDWSGALINAAFFTLLILGLDHVGDPVGRPLAVAEIVAGLGFGVLLFRQQAGRSAGLLPVDLFRIPLFALSSVTSICSYAAQSIALIALPFFIQNGLGRAELATGFLVAPWPLAVAAVAKFAGRQADRRPVGLLAGSGLGALACGLLLLATLPPNPTIPDVVWRVVISGMGFGFFQTPNNRAMMTAGPMQRSAAANGAMVASRLLGQTGGAATVAMIFLIAHGPAPRTAFLTACAFAALGSGLSLLRLTPAAKTR